MIEKCADPNGELAKRIQQVWIGLFTPPPPPRYVPKDVFMAEMGKAIVSLGPIFDYLKARGCAMRGEYIVIAGWPVQFLPPTSRLVEEALRDAVTMDVEGTLACVFTAEHLAAIALQTGRAKDKARLLQFIEARALDAARFQAIVARHGLVDVWKRFEKQFLSDTS